MGGCARRGRVQLDRLPSAVTTTAALGAELQSVRRSPAARVVPGSEVRLGASGERQRRGQRCSATGAGRSSGAAMSSETEDAGESGGETEEKVVSDRNL